MRGLLRRRRGAAEVCLPADVTSHEAAAIAKEIRQALGNCPGPVLVVDFSQVRRLSGSGAGLLFSAAASARARGIRLRAEGASPRLQAELHKFGLTKILTSSGR